MDLLFNSSTVVMPVVNDSYFVGLESLSQIERIRLLFRTE